MTLDTEQTLQTLKGLKGVYVVVERLTPEAETPCPSNTTIQTDVEGRLREAGIKVLTRTTWLEEPGSPYFYIHVGSCPPHTEIGLYAVYITVELNQWVRLDRDSSIRAFGYTWSSQGELFSVGREKLVNSVRSHIKDQVDDFVNAYLSVNPK